MPTSSPVQRVSGLVEALGHQPPCSQVLVPCWGLVWPRGPRFFSGLEASARAPQVLELFLAFSHKGSLPHATQVCELCLPHQH